MAEEKTTEQIVEGINTSIESIKKDVNQKADAEKVEAKIDDLKSQIASVVGEEGYLNKQQGQLDQLESDMKSMKENQGKKEDNPFDQIEKGLKSEDFQSFKKTPGKKASSYNMEVKASPITTGDINSGTIRMQYEPGVDKHPWQQTPLFDSIPKNPVGAGRDQVAWWEVASIGDNSEAGISEGSAPSSASYKTWTKQNLDIIMIGDYTKVSRSALEDWEYTRGEALDLLNNQVPLKIENELLQGSNLTGIIGQSKSFSKPDNFDKVSQANYIDAIRAIALQIMNGDTTESNKNGYMPNVNLVNSGVLTNMRGMKDSNGGYIIPPLSSFETNVDGIRNMASSKLSSDTYLMGDMTKAKMYIKRAMELRFYYENEDDALKDLVTIHAIARVAGVKIATPHKYAFVTGTFSAAKSAIESTSG